MIVAFEKLQKDVLNSYAITLESSLDSCRVKNAFRLAQEIRDENGFWREHPHLDAKVSQYY